MSNIFYCPFSAHFLECYLFWPLPVCAGSVFSDSFQVNGIRKYVIVTHLPVEAKTLPTHAVCPDGIRSKVYHPGKRQPNDIHQR